MVMGYVLSESCSVVNYKNSTVVERATIDRDERRNEDDTKCFVSSSLLSYQPTLRNHYRMDK